MTGKEYLLQARYLDERIHSKIQQIESLNDLATSCSAVISDMPRNPNQGGSKMADAVISGIFVAAARLPPDTDGCGRIIRYGFCDDCYAVVKDSLLIHLINAGLHP